MDRPGLRSAWPFAACLVVGLLVMMLPQYAAERWHLVLAGVLLVGAMVATAAVMRRASPGWRDALPAGFVLLALAVVFDGSGGTGSPLVTLVAVPVLWTALFGRRRDLVLCGLATFALLLGPIVLIGGDRYPWDHVARPVLWTAITLFLGPAVQSAVRQWRLERRRQLSVTAELQAVLGGSRTAGLVTCDVDGTVLSFGVGAERLLGYRAEEVVGQHLAVVWHDNGELAEVAAELGMAPGFEVLAVLAGQDAEPRTWRLRRKDGSRVFVKLALTALHVEGRMTGYLCVAIDCTEEVLRRREVDRANARWQFLVDHLPDTALFTLDCDLRLGQVAGAGATALGLRDAEGRSLQELSSSGNIAVLSEMLERALAGEAVAHDLAATANGREQEVLMTRLLDPHSPAEASREVLVLARDVSRERRRSDALARERDRAELFFNQAPSGVLLLDLAGQILRANPAACAMLHADADELVGTGLEDLSAVPGDPAVQDHLSLLAAVGQARSRWQARTIGGQSVSVALTSTQVPATATPAAEDDEVTGGAVLMHLVDVSEQERYQAQLQRLADHDALTGLLNRRRFETDLESHLAHGRRYGPRGAVLMLDLDHFKEVNDTLGHAAGDQLIISLADALRGRLRDTDLVARLGGDEFAVLLAEADRATTRLVAEDLLATVRAKVSTFHGPQQRVTVSMGAVLIEDTKLTAPDVMSTADMLLYDAKEDGRDRYALLEPERHEVPRSGARMMWAEKIERALETDGLELHLQPVLDVRTGTVDGAEVLVRLRDGDQLVGPGRFLYIAERSNLIVRLDRWVIRHSLALLEQLQQLRPGFRLEVNMSGRSVGDPGVENELAEGLSRHRIDPQTLVLEITETAAVANIAQAQGFAERLAALGCRFALDDFGAGFGSFYYLKHLAFDYVKIDGEFIANCHRSTRDRAILHAIVEMTQSLGKQTVAEFVTDEAILQVLRDEGVDHAQGFHVGHAVPIPEFVGQWVADPAAVTSLRGRGPVLAVAGAGRTVRGERLPA